MQPEVAHLLTVTGLAITLGLGIYNAIQNAKHSKRSSFINTVTSERVKWIERTRQSLSVFCGLVIHWNMSRKRDDPSAAEILKQGYLITLQLNPTGQADSEILKIIDQVSRQISEGTFISDDQQRNLLRDLTHNGQQLFKDEWNKVKTESIDGNKTKSSAGKLGSAPR